MRWFARLSRTVTQYFWWWWYGTPLYIFFQKTLKHHLNCCACASWPFCTQIYNKLSLWFFVVWCFNKLEKTVAHKNKEGRWTFSPYSRLPRPGQQINMRKKSERSTLMKLTIIMSRSKSVDNILTFFTCSNSFQRGRNGFPFISFLQKNTITLFSFSFFKKNVQLHNAKQKLTKK